MIRVEALLALASLLVACAPSLPDYYGADIDLSGASRPVPAELVERLVPPEQHGYPDGPIRRHRPLQKLPHEFRSVSSDTARVLVSPDERVRMAQEVVSSFESRRRDPGRFARAVGRMDAVAEEILEASGFPRTPNVSAAVDFLPYAGLYFPQERRIVVGYEHLALGIAPKTSRYPSDQDEPYGTWIHESLHARAATALPTRSGGLPRIDPAPFEEALAEVLTAEVCRRSRFDCGTPADRSWKGIWGAAATGLGVDEQDLVHNLARHGLYEVRAALPSVAGSLYSETHGGEVDAELLSRMLAQVDEMAHSPLPCVD